MAVTLGGFEVRYIDKDIIQAIVDLIGSEPLYENIPYQLNWI
jgi:hypothetical protein